LTIKKTFGNVHTLVKQVLMFVGWGSSHVFYLLLLLLLFKKNLWNKQIQ